MIIMPKIIYDNIHGYIELNDICIQIIDTPIYQRLREIKQLGACYFVYPNATHTRFEHSIGVCYLAGELIMNIKNNQPELNITDEMIENIKIAGLCHDLGHGPFSHLFDNNLLKDSKSDNKDHEIRSCKLFKLLIKDHNINISDKRIEIIQELIYPMNRIDLDIPEYMYQIVCNVTNNIDVDKFDYLKRDSYILGLSYSFDYTRIIKQARIISNQMCYPRKIASSIYQIFITRWRLHTEIYTHPALREIELMLADCLKSAEKSLRLISSIDNMNHFYYITDHILKIIEYSNDLDLQYSKHILYRIKKRDLYKYVGEIKFDNNNDINHVITNINIDQFNIESHDFIIDIVKIGYKTDPVKNVRFYDMDDLNNSYILDNSQISNLIPEEFADNILRIYCKNKLKIGEVKKYYSELCKFI